jgi:DNA-binding NtrC family response regulator
MPDMDGEQTCAELRRHWPGLPVIVSSGYTELEVLPRFAAHGNVTFVQKPYGYDTLVHAVQEVLQDQTEAGTGSD